MNVRELMAELQKMPPHLDVVIAETGGDEYVPVVQVLYEDGTSQIALLDQVVETVDVPPDPECPHGTCRDGCIHAPHDS